jgi:hypothetical protein
MGANLVLCCGPALHVLLHDAELFVYMVALRPSRANVPAGGSSDHICMNAWRSLQYRNGFEVRHLMSRYLAFHSRGGNHCHLNFIGITADQAVSAQEKITSAAFARDFSLSHLRKQDGAEGQQALKGLVGTGQYFQAFLPDGSRLVHPVQRFGPFLSAPPQRQMSCSPAIHAGADIATQQSCVLFVSTEWTACFQE